MSLQLMAKHAYLARRDRSRLRMIQGQLGMSGFADRDWADLPENKRWYQEMHSTSVWLLGMSGVAAANLGVAVVLLFN